MQTIVLTILVFAVLIFLHEFGHFITAKLCGIRVLEFSIGMGPKLLQSTKHETTLTLRALPIGGYVQLEGEEAGSDDPRAFCNQKAWKRFLVLAAGAAMNLLLGYLLCILVFLPQEILPRCTVASFRENAVSSEQGLMEGDEILAVNGHRIFTSSDLVTYLLQDSTSSSRTLTVRRQGQTLRLDPISFETAQNEDGSEGLYIDFYLTPMENNFVRTAGYAGRTVLSFARLIWSSLVDMVTGKIPFSELSGPVGVGSAVSEAVNYGWDSLILLTAILTINLGMFNLLPIPALDGGRLLFVLIEMILRRPVPAKYENAIHAIGMLLLLLLMAAVTIKDLTHLF